MTVLGIIVLLAGAGLVAYEAHIPTAGLVGGAGLIAVIAGVALAVSGLGAGLAVTLVVAAAVAAAAVATAAVVTRRVASARRSLPRGGTVGLMGHMGVVRSWSGESGRVLVDGALWRARTGSARDTLEVGDTVIVDHVHGLTLAIHKAEEWEVPSWAQ